MNIGLGQLVIILILLALLWGNFPQVFKNIISNIREFLDKSSKKYKAGESKNKNDSN
jgi:Sec-independent protein translocase protein TatA